MLTTAQRQGKDREIIMARGALSNWSSEVQISAEDYNELYWGSRICRQGVAMALIECSSCWWRKRFSAGTKFIRDKLSQTDIYSGGVWVRKNLESLSDWNDDILFLGRAAHKGNFST